MSDPLALPIDELRIGERLRKVDPGHVKALADSIAEIGLQTPISVYETVRFEDGKSIPCFELVAGLHRLEACKSLGLAEIDVRVVSLDEIDRGLWECDENLARAELSDAARARFTARRKELYEIKHPETRHGGERPSRQLGDLPQPDRFTADTATKTGKSERSVQRDARRGEKIADDVLEELEGTEHDKGVTLDKIARMAPKEQRQAVKRLKEGKSLPEPKAKPWAAQLLQGGRTTEDSIGLATLKRAWSHATPADRTAFLEWLKAQAA